MIKSVVVFLALLSLFRCEVQESEAPGACKANGRDGNMFTLAINRMFDQNSGNWVRNFLAKRTNSGKLSSNLELEVTQGNVECQGKHTTYINVTVKEVNDNQLGAVNGYDNLVFHSRHGTNVVIMNNGRSAQKLDLDDVLNSVVFTHRPLRNNELFEVRLDKRTTKTNHCFALGVMTHSPDTVQILPSMHQLKNGTWMFHNSNIYGSAKELSKYGHNLNTIQARDRLGVMRREDGSIHFFLNGVDLGRAVENVPEPVYGVFEAWYDAVKGTIVY